MELFISHMVPTQQEMFIAIHNICMYYPSSVVSIALLRFSEALTVAYEYLKTFFLCNKNLDSSSDNRSISINT